MEATLNYQGKGHSCGIHTKDNAKVDKLARRMKVSRIMVNQAQALANSGSWSNGMPITMTLGAPHGDTTVRAIM
jgi:sulfoacetaldehyde dehydrogenase